MDEEWLAVRFAMLCADSKGMVRSGRLLFDHAVRTCLMIDFAFQGRIRQGIDDTAIDTTPTGFAPADRVLDYVDLHPTQSMAQALAHADVGVVDVLDPTRMAESRRRRNRPCRVDAKLVRFSRQRLAETAETGKTESAQTAALAAIAGTLRWTTNEHTTTLVARCGSARGLVSDCCAYLSALIARYDFVSTVPTTSG